MTEHNPPLRPEGEEQPEPEEIISMLAQLTPVEYDQRRETEAESLGIRLSTLDSEVAKQRGNGSSNGPDVQGRAVSFADPEPWPGPVAGDELLDELEGVFCTYMTLPPGAATASTLWVAFSHAHDAFQVSPLLGITSAVKGCGKSTYLTMLSGVVRRPLSAANISTAAVFRTIEKFQPTLLVDEADTFLGDNDELRGVLNSGFLLSCAAVVRTVGDEHEPKLFSTWSPKAVAMIGKLPETLADRAIGIRLERQTAKEERAITKLRSDRLNQFEPLRRRLWQWAQDNRKVLRDADPTLPDELSNREADKWRPLLAIAEVAGGKWPERARVAIKQIGGCASDDQALNVRLLADIKLVFDQLGEARVTSERLVETLVAIEESPWSEVNRGRPLTPARLARFLGPFGIASRNIRVAEKPNPTKGYSRESFADAWDRYLAPKLLQVLQTSEDAAEMHFSRVLQDPSVGVSRNEESPTKTLVVGGVGGFNKGEADGDEGDAEVEL